MQRNVPRCLRIVLMAGASTLVVALAGDALAQTGYDQMILAKAKTNFAAAWNVIQWFLYAFAAFGLAVIIKKVFTKQAHLTDIMLWGLATFFSGVVGYTVAVFSGVAPF